MDMSDLMLRLLVSFFSGSLLCLSGSLIQTATVNELAGPSTLGFEAVIVVVILLSHFLNVLGLVHLPYEYLAFLFFALLLIFLKIKNYHAKTKRSIESLILIGLCLNLLIGSLFSLLQFLFFTLNIEFPTELWFGNFRFVTPVALFIMFAVSVFVYFSLVSLKKNLLGIQLGENVSTNLKIDHDKTLSNATWLSFLAVGTVTIHFGVFSFVGLIFPHLLRRFNFFKTNLWAELFIGSLISGAIFMLLDLGCREFLFFSAEIPVGMISSILGSGLLMYFLLAKKDPQ